MRKGKEYYWGYGDPSPPHSRPNSGLFRGMAGCSMVSHDSSRDSRKLFRDLTSRQTGNGKEQRL